jgi:aryl-alcohol dehydrogenase-like predicted oxidoreductase
MYQDSEDLLGKWFKLNPGKREHIFLATKFANAMREDGSRYVDSSPEYLRKACEKSLSRLGVSHIDLYYCHRLDQVTPIEKTVEEMKKLKHEGKIKYLGLSECSSESLRRACKVEHIDAVQIEYVPALIALIAYLETNNFTGTRPSVSTSSLSRSASSRPHASSASPS